MDLKHIMSLFYCYVLQAKEKERRMRLREEKMEEQRVAQEERLKRALERAQADPKKRVGYVGTCTVRPLFQESCTVHIISPLIYTNSSDRQHAPPSLSGRS